MHEKPDFVSPQQWAQIIAIADSLLRLAGAK